MTSVPQPFNVFGALPSDDTRQGTSWVTTWFGAVHPNPAVPSEDQIEVCMTPLGGELDPSGECRPAGWDSSRAQWVRVGVGALPAIHLGQVWRRGKHIGTLSCTQHVFKLVFSEDRMRIVTTESRVSSRTSGSTERVPIIPRNQYPIGRPTPTESASRRAHSLVVDTGTPKVRLLIPCAEVIRFYYANSRDLSLAVFRGYGVEESPGSAPHLHSLYDPDPAFTNITRSGEARLRLRRGVIKHDAPIVARLCFSTLARTRALNVFAQLQKHNSDGESRLLAFPPFDGKTELKVHGLWIEPEFEQRDARYFLVLRIASCSGAFPFSSLVYTREGDHDNTTEDEPEGDREPDDREPPDLRQFPPRGQRKDPVDHVGEPDPRVRTRQEIIDTGRFSALNKISIKSERVKGKPRRRKVVKPDPPEESEGHSTGGGTEMDSPLDPLSYIQDPLGHEGNPEEPDGQQVGAHDLETFLLAMDEVGLQDRMDVEYRQIGWSPAATADLPVSMLPAPPAGVPSWLYIDFQTQRRRHAIIAEVRFNEKYVYACEVERRRKESFKLLFFMRRGGGRCDDAVLTEVLRACVRAKGIWVRWAPTTIVYQAVKHPPRAATRDEDVQRLERLAVSIIQELYAYP